MPDAGARAHLARSIATGTLPFLLDQVGERAPAVTAVTAVQLRSDKKAVLTPGMSGALIEEHEAPETLIVDQVAGISPAALVSRLADEVLGTCGDPDGATVNDGQCRD